MTILCKRIPGKDVDGMQMEPLNIEESFPSVVKADLDALRQVDIRTVSLDNLVDIRDVAIDENLPREQRMAEFVRQVKNPYCFKVGKVAVSVGFSGDGVTLGQRMEQYLKTL